MHITYIENTNSLDRHVYHLQMIHIMHCYRRLSETRTVCYYYLYIIYFYNFGLLCLWRRWNQMKVLVAFGSCLLFGQVVIFCLIPHLHCQFYIYFSEYWQCTFLFKHVNSLNKLNTDDCIIKFCWKSISSFEMIMYNFYFSHTTTHRVFWSFIPFVLLAHFHF